MSEGQAIVAQNCGSALSSGNGYARRVARDIVQLALIQNGVSSRESSQSCLG